MWSQLCGIPPWLPFKRNKYRSSSLEKNILSLGLQNHTYAQNMDLLIKHQTYKETNIHEKESSEITNNRSFKDLRSGNIKYL